MNVEYNDYQILSPDKMEHIAKKYNEALNRKNREENEIKFDEDISLCFFQLKHTVGVIKNYLSKRKNSLKTNAINTIYNLLQQIDNSYFYCNNFNAVRINNYYQAIKLCINCSYKIIDYCVKNQYDGSIVINFLDVLKCLIDLL